MIINIAFMIFDITSVVYIGLGPMFKPVRQVKLLAMSKKDQELYAGLSRTGCGDICLAVKSPENGKWKTVSDVFYALKAQKPMPWATYAKLTGYLVDKGFLEKSKRMEGRRRLNFLRLTASGEELVKLYVEIFYHRKVEDLTPEQ